ncbi:MAG: fibronectin type III domain-containing protein, partial [bacterium]|nr:fibronectin type III domain-containing protein [bacterium]
MRIKTYFGGNYAWHYIRTKTAVAPSVPAAPTARAAHNGALVSWSAPSNVGSAFEIEDYDLRFYAGTSDPTDDDDWVEEGETDNLNRNDNTTTSATIIGLKASTTYRVQVRAVGDDTNSAWSASGTFTTSTAVAANTLISNHGQLATGSQTAAFHDLAQGFSTGSNTGGYLLTSVELGQWTTTGTPGRTLTATIATGLPSATTAVATLISPLNSNDGTTLAFTAPPGTVLNASTTYWLVLEFDSDTESAPQLSYMTHDAEDAGGAAGWSIANAGLQRLAATTGAWNAPDNRSMEIRVNGLAVDQTAPGVDSADAVRNVLTIT